MSDDQLKPTAEELENQSTFTEWKDEIELRAALYAEKSKLWTIGLVLGFFILTVLSDR